MADPRPARIECPYRRPAVDRADDVAVCGILQDLTRVEETGLCHVQQDACQSCCRWFRPNLQHINPVVASLLYNVTAEILARGGVPGCPRTEAVRLHELATQNIPADDDCISVVDAVSDQANLDAPDLEQIIPRPRVRSGRRVTEWSVGVTTAPREQATLEACLASLNAAGWPEPRLFIDGATSIPDRFSHLPQTRRTPQIGAWPSYYLALLEMYLRSPRAEAYMLVQDDVVFFRHPALRSYLESILWPGDVPGLVSMFCSSAYTQANAGWHKLDEALIWGGQAIIFSRDAVVAFLSDPQVVDHRASPGNQGLANIDWLIGVWASRRGLPVYLPTPSLAQHIGHVSALWPNVRAFGNRRANRFAGG
ncbi:MAG: hypothetical protein HY290_25550 [Planctomycetia bacterium]|nr:hypothetical protein [Planctomycetia bacterium]